MASQSEITRNRPTFRKPRTASPSRAIAVSLAAAAVALVLVASAVVAFANGAAGSRASTPTARAASAPAQAVAKGASVRSRHARKRAAAKAPATATKRRALAVATSTPVHARAASPKPAKHTRSVAAASKSAVAVAAAPKTLPQQMRSTLGASTQMIVITGARIGSRSGTLRVFNKNSGRWVEVFSAAANFGANGLVDGAKRREGHLETPTGIWHLGGFLFGQHGSAPKGTKMPYRAITSRSWWSCQRDSTYNTWVDSGSHVSGEHLAGATVQYEYAFNTGYNSLPNQRVMGRGTAIFIHCAEPAGNSLGKYTHGCIALSRADMRRLFALLDPARHPSCAIGTLASGTSTAIYSY